jgi:hypothetical protein
LDKPEVQPSPFDKLRAGSTGLDFVMVVLTQTLLAPVRRQAGTVTLCSSPADPSPTALEDTSQQPASLANNWNCCNLIIIQELTVNLAISNDKFELKTPESATIQKLD